MQTKIKLTRGFYVGSVPPPNTRAVLTFHADNAYTLPTAYFLLTLKLYHL